MRSGLLAVALAPCLALPCAAQHASTQTLPCAAESDATPELLREALRTIRARLLAAVLDTPPEDAISSLRAAAEIALVEAALREPAGPHLALVHTSDPTPQLVFEAHDLRSLTHPLALDCGCCSLSLHSTRCQAKAAFAAIDELWSAVTTSETPTTAAVCALRASPSLLGVGIANHGARQGFAVVIEGAGHTTPRVRAPEFVADCVARALPSSRAGGRWLVQGRIAIDAPGAHRAGHLVISDGWDRTIEIPICARTSWLWQSDRTEVEARRQTDGRWEAVIDCQRLDAAPPGLPKGEILTPRHGLTVTIVGNGPRRCRAIVTERATTSTGATLALHCPGHEDPLLVRINGADQESRRR